jgi:mRNA-degrading endonuclease RelE of RelBE toxin-antitoxin system
MDLVPSFRFEKSMRRLDRKTRELVYNKLELFLQNKMHPSLRYKTVQALKHLRPPVKEISITMSIRVTLQEFEDHVYLRNVGGHDILP